MWARWIVCSTAALLAGCAPRSPRETLEAYRDALKRRDFDAVWALSSSSVRRARDPAHLAASVEERPETIVQAEARMEACTSSIAREVFEIEIAGGGTVRLSKEDGEWRVLDGILDLSSFDTPERALDTFFRAIDAGDLSIARRAIPKQLAPGFASDQALSAHLLHMSPRIARARAGLGTLFAGRAEIEGDHAEIAYGEGCRAVFEREEGVWRILDLE